MFVCITHTMIAPTAASAAPAKMVTRPSLHLPFVCLPDVNFELSSSDYAHVQVQCNKEVTFQHPKHDFVVQRYEIFGLHDRCKEVIIG
jgi:hypothetical protein